MEDFISRILLENRAADIRSSILMVLPIWMIFLTNCLEKKGGFHATGGFGGRSGFGSSGEFGSGFGGVHEERGQNIETEVPISFEEAVFGCDKRFTLSSSDGKSQNFEVHIPAGIANGQSVRLKGKRTERVQWKGRRSADQSQSRRKNLVTSEKARMFIRR